MKSTIHKRGEKLLIDLPIELARGLGWDEGEILNIEQVEAGLKIQRTMTAHDHTMKIAHECMDEYREAFEKLAKS